MWARRIYCFVVLFVLVGVSSCRHLPPNLSSNNIQGSSLLLSFSKLSFHTKTKGKGTVQNQTLIPNQEEREGKNKKIGSRAPSCEHKCYGCMPCEAIQVPTTTSHLGLLYTNYEPESWKCKCGPSFYTP